MEKVYEATEYTIWPFIDITWLPYARICYILLVGLQAQATLPYTEWALWKAQRVPIEESIFSGYWTFDVVFIWQTYINIYAFS